MLVPRWFELARRQVLRLAQQEKSHSRLLQKLLPRLQTNCLILELLVDNLVFAGGETDLCVADTSVISFVDSPLDSQRKHMPVVAFNDLRISKVSLTVCRSCE